MPLPTPRRIIRQDLVAAYREDEVEELTQNDALLALGVLLDHSRTPATEAIADTRAAV